MVRVVGASRKNSIGKTKEETPRLLGCFSGDFFKPWTLLFSTFWGTFSIFSRVLKQILGVDGFFFRFFRGFLRSGVLGFL